MFFSRENISHSVIRNSISMAAISHHTCRLLCLTEDPVKPQAANQDSVWFRGNATTDSSQEGKDHYPILYMPRLVHRKPRVSEI